MSQARNLPESDALDLLQDSLASLYPQSQPEFEIEFFSQVLRRNPDYLDVLRCQGQLLSRKGLHPEALAVDRRVVQLAPKDPIARYNLACSLAHVGSVGEAIASLRQALACGYRDWDYLEADPDLDVLRPDPEYRELLREFSRL